MRSTHYSFELIDSNAHPLLPALHHPLLDTLPQLHTSHQLYHSMGWRDIAAYNDNPVTGVRFMALDLSDLGVKTVTSD